MTVGDFSEGLAVIKQKPNANRHSEQHDRGGMEKLEFDEIVHFVFFLITNRGVNAYTEHTFVVDLNPLNH